MSKPESIIDFYYVGIAKNINEFVEKICHIASDIENTTEEGTRQTAIMENMLQVFDDLACKDVKEKSAWDI